MAKVEPFHACSLDCTESRKRKSSRVPLPYLIRPRRILSPCDSSFSLYNDYLEYSSLIVKVNCSGLQNESNATLPDGLLDEKDEDFVLVCDYETEQEGEPECDDDWVVV